MFTGITTDVGEVVAVEPKAEGLRRLKIACAYPRAAYRDRRFDRAFRRLPHGGRDRRAGRPHVLCGRCRGRNAAHDDGRRLEATGTRLNLERALKVGDELGGHIVAGHVDGVAELVAREDLTDMARLTLARAAPI